MSAIVPTKCAEVFFASQQNDFLIICTCCDDKSFNFAAFSLHFNATHLQQAKQQQQQAEDSALLQQYDEIPIAMEIKAEITNDELLADNDSHNSNADNAADEPVDSESSSSCSEQVADFQSKTKLRRATTTTYECCDCKQLYKTAKTLLTHRRKQHTALLAFPCRRCRRRFATQLECNEHIQMRHNKIYACDQCEKSFKNSVSLSRHKYNHTDKRDFKCQICSSTFKHSFALYKHQRIVHTEPKYICEICGFRTRLKSSLVVHKRQHSGERPYKCQKCDKDFITKSALIEHGAVHQPNLRNHKCDVCNAAFSARKSLYHHKFLHSNVKKFVCKVCNQAYAQAAGLAAHLRKHKQPQLQIDLPFT